MFDVPIQAAIGRKMLPAKPSARCARTSWPSATAATSRANANSWRSRRPVRAKKRVGRSTCRKRRLWPCCGWRNPRCSRGAPAGVRVARRDLSLRCAFACEAHVPESTCDRGRGDGRYVRALRKWSGFGRLRHPISVGAHRRFCDGSDSNPMASGSCAGEPSRLEGSLQTSARIGRIRSFPGARGFASSFSASPTPTPDGRALRPTKST